MPELGGRPSTLALSKAPGSVPRDGTAAKARLKGECLGLRRRWAWGHDSGRARPRDDEGARAKPWECVAGPRKTAEGAWGQDA
nr:unnamed protein product [Digitaria exilis]